MTYFKDPEAPSAGGIEIHDNAIVVPFGAGKVPRGISRRAGVFTADGTYCVTARCWRSHKTAATAEPEPPAEDEIKRTLPGTSLFCGMTYGHFGHALCESTARLWALDHVDGPVDRLLFLPKRRYGQQQRALARVPTILGTLGELPTAHAAVGTVRCERLIVPPQGFGLGNLIRGTPEMRAFMNARLRDRVQPEGPERLYISRSALFRKRGRLLFEHEIEARLAAEGYEIFHPQQHPIETQLSRYAAARDIISTDNSALHLAAFVATPECRVAILLRRPSGIYRDFQNHLNWFAGIDPTIVPTVKGVWVQDGLPDRNNEVMTLIDMAESGATLATAGMIADASTWVNPTEDEVAAEVAALEERIERGLTRIE
ncbi:MAG: glycosyltransferase family 61 protein [Pseudomonadota bacterium]